MVKMALHLMLEYLHSVLGSGTGFLLMQTLEGSHKGSSCWISTTCMETWTESSDPSQNQMLSCTAVSIHLLGVYYLSDTIFGAEIMVISKCGSISVTCTDLNYTNNSQVFLSAKVARGCLKVGI